MASKRSTSFNHNKDARVEEGEVKFKMNEFYYLVHGGPGSGRYPLGSGDRPYQKFEGSRKKSSGITGYIKSRREKRAEERQLRIKNEESRKKAEAERRERQLDADKERVLREGSAAEVLKYQGRLTNQELQQAFNRLNLETNLRNMSQKEIKTKADKVDDIMKMIKTGTEWAKIGTDTYNTLAQIWNATPEGQKGPLPLVGKGDGGKKK